MTIWRWNELSNTVPGIRAVDTGRRRYGLGTIASPWPAFGLHNLFLKLEHGNATGSYKDRFASTAVSHMVANGQTRCIATSSGNTGAALAAYCAAARIECHIALVEGAPIGKLRQMMAYGAKTARIKDFGTDASTTIDVFQRLERLGQRPDSALQISAYVFSPLGMSGVESLAYELAEQLPAGIDHVFCPAGGGGLCVATARGFQQLVSQGRWPTAPAVECVQPEGNNTIAGPLRAEATQAEEVASTTHISGLQVASVVDGHLAVEACRETGGTGHLVTDDFVWEIQKRLASEEGVFAEPAGAVALAGALNAARRKEISLDATVVCMVTGSGFKDLSAIDRMNQGTECPLLAASAIDAW